ncbi:oxygenase MpaB family protein [Nocardiopsis sp. RSe5-2]|uniref:Oxygenase MpaB family protein n=1 Tax=Nocardiopsis endophytica TaxID=3018445 RepID=A0ABT4UCC0_9ACTN|nr:oxygenase MpaB family protein [Nocardiopsis endophytica]MDA2814568.1 oxygenase MpaB family protein [Nocardiopsis endophytica]
MSQGMFADDAVIRRVNREASTLLAAAYAILLQVAHPAVGQGVGDHSDFASRPLDRLRGTLTFVYGSVFGTREEAERVARIVRAVHRHVVGPGYDARDPDLQVWVAATLYEGAVRIHGLVFGELSPGEKEELLGQCALFATSLGCPADRWPADLPSFERYWKEMVEGIEVGDAARGIAQDLFTPRNRALRPLTAVQRFIASGMLPPTVREGFGLEWDERRGRRFDRFFAVVRAVYPRLPMRVRTLPRDLYLRDMRRKAARGRAVRR